ncbi:branched-chain amino acid ABC transporter ATP-binding protein/permease [Ramlibacter sp. Leaf400]|uniref:branched-chain amino acid ABC transporter ATP-binding protein/permease n=1 Tax=Ramlibacter sp. Leaf400 TaxID=1736365 RepID=UPI0006FB35DD|nr:branched-chain amino acid ABC transporter ATP-binding protein/permease [Ramlibacter sp. Leaf400]KQT13910.1 branched-chain amino acid ABC transporter permease [Ramlibacter sp. Leaf400]
MKPRAAPAAVLGAGLLLAALPFLRLPAFYESFLYLALFWVVLATSWNILSGYAGYFSFGHGAFFGAGVYTSATLAAKFDWPFLWTLPVAALVAAAIGVGVGAVAFRVRGVRGELFALLTLAVTFVVATIVGNTPIDGGPGVYLNAVPVPKIGPTPTSSLFLMMLAAAVATLLVSWAIRHSRFGAGLFAIHDDEEAAEVMGVPTYRWKLAALAVSCALAGWVGGIHALFISYVTTAETFNLTVPLTVVLMSILGGTRHWAGPAIGAVAITCLLFAFTGGEFAVLGKGAIGLILVVGILFMPEGVMGKLRRQPRHSREGGNPGLPPSPAPAIVAAPAPVEALDPRLRGDDGSCSVDGGRGRGAPPAPPLLVVRNLSKSFRGLKALSSVNLEVRQGEILGLLGPNGSGKSTFINVVSGHFLPDGGQVLLDGRDIAGLPAHRIARAGIARTYQIPRPFSQMSVLDNVAIAAMYAGQGLGSMDEGRREAVQWLEFAHLAGKAQVLPGELNLHQRKFLELARALASRPRLVLLDEVLCGLTPTEIQSAVALIRRIRDHGTTIVFVEHVMDAVMALTDRIVVFDQGAMLAEGAPREVMRSPAVMSAYLGVSHA